MAILVLKMIPAAKPKSAAILGIIKNVILGIGRMMIEMNSIVEITGVLKERISYILIQEFGIVECGQGIVLNLLSNNNKTMRMEVSDKHVQCYYL